ncbi:MAG TPA: MBL fold metallo-hydrolase, partial [Burkholderiales bacterium]|nr:MBL fold metallo-hydrolase [Burkholderiales bacterium]
MADVIDYEFGISAIDSGYQRPRLDAIHLIVENGRAAIVDTGVNSSVPHVLAALSAKGIAPAQVDYVVLTHIHLDHAGGAGLLLSQLPNAMLTVHPRGARHIIDPAKLIASTEAVYGADAMARTYGRIVPVPRERVIETPHGASISLNGRELAFYDTPGHARHHVCALDAKSGHLFAGDTFGLSYRELD